MNERVQRRGYHIIVAQLCGGAQAAAASAVEARACMGIEALSAQAWRWSVSVTITSPDCWCRYCLCSTPMMRRPLLHALLEPGVAACTGADLDSVQVAKPTAFTQHTAADLKLLEKNLKLNPVQDLLSSAVARRPLLHALLEPCVAACTGVELDRVKVAKSTAFMQRTAADLKLRRISMRLTPTMHCSPIERVRVCAAHLGNANKASTPWLLECIRMSA